jgi:LPXTG-motif cell wall-anchored protein
MTDNTALLSSLNLFTLITVLLLLIGSFVYFLRKRRNRAATSHALGLDDTKRSGPSSEGASAS